MRLPVNALIGEIGIDAVVSVLFPRACLLVLLWTCVFDLSVVLWANAEGGGHLNQQNYSDMDVLSMGNIPAGSPKFWAHLVSVVLKTVVTLKVVDKVLARPASLRTCQSRRRARTNSVRTGSIAQCVGLSC